MIIFFDFLYQNNLASFFNLLIKTSTLSTIAPPFLTAGASVLMVYNELCNLPNFSKGMVSSGLDFALKLNNSSYFHNIWNTCESGSVQSKIACNHSW